MSNILLIEPNYKNKYPPLGLMKISYFHKYIMHDYVRFTKGVLPEAFSNTKWDHVYVTTLFTFEWSNTIAAIEYAKTLVNSIDQITVGGIAATMLPDDIFRDTGIHPVTGLLNEPGKLGLPGDECIDQIVPDYSILNDVSYEYPFSNAYFLSATKGCGNNCGFCAVQTLEPTYVPYMDIKEKVAAIDREFGPKKDLLLMDNNVLRSPKFNQIIDDIIEAGFGKGASYINPKTGKAIKRFVDFNQGIDALFLTEEKAKRLGEIALKPARIAFDHIEDQDIYERALRLCAKYGITHLSNYVLYNSESFGGKGRKYSADTPADLYDRMRITLDIRDDINKDRSESEQVAAFSFPMRYIPLSAHERGYVGSKWNAKFLRAVQCMLIPTQGKGVGSRSFFEADFGKSAEEFEKFLCMPERLITARGDYDKRKKATSRIEKSDLNTRKEAWKRNQRIIIEWNRLFSGLGEKRDEFITIIADNEFLPEKVLGISSITYKKLYLFYLTKPRVLSLLGLLSPNSPTYDEIKAYIHDEFSLFYEDILHFVVTNETQQKYIFTNFVDFFGRDGIRDVAKELLKKDSFADRLLKKWDIICKNKGITYIDFELIRVFIRFIDSGVLSDSDIADGKLYISELDMSNLAALLNDHLQDFESYVEECIDDRFGQDLLHGISKAIFTNIQLKLFQLMGE